MKLWIKIAVSASLLAILFWILPWHEVRAAVARLSAFVWLSALCGFLAGHRLGVEKWRMLINAGRAALSRTDAVRCYAAGLFANICLPSIVGGDVLRAALATRVTRRPEATVLGSVADRILDIAVSGVLILIGGFMARDALPGWGADALAVAILLGVLASAVALPLVFRRPLARWPRRLRRPIGRSLVAVRYLARSPRTALAACAISAVVQAGFVLLNAWIGASIGVAVPLAVWFFAWPLAKIAGLLPISLGGLAVRDATLGALLVPAGVPLALGVIASLIWQSVVIAGGLLGGLLWWGMSRRAGEPSRALRRNLSLASAPLRDHG
jgi:uncharacterized membrane protein YbhN (UPF0104 family)